MSKIYVVLINPYTAHYNKKAFLLTFPKLYNLFLKKKSLNASSS